MYSSSRVQRVCFESSLRRGKIDIDMSQADASGSASYQTHADARGKKSPNYVEKRDAKASSAAGTRFGLCLCHILSFTFVCAHAPRAVKPAFHSSYRSPIRDSKASTCLVRARQPEGPIWWSIQMITLLVFVSPIISP